MLRGRNGGTRKYSKDMNLVNNLGLEIVYGEADDKKLSGSSGKASPSNASNASKKTKASLPSPVSGFQ